MKSSFLQLAIAIIFLCFFLVGYGFLYSTISSKSATLASLDSQIAEKTRLAKRTSSAQSELAGIEDAETAVQSYFVPETGVVSFIDGLEAQGKTQGSTINVLSVSSGTANGRPIFLLALTVHGTFDAVMRTVGTIEYAPYDLSIPQLSLVQDDKNSWHADLSLTVGSMSTATSTSS